MTAHQRAVPPLGYAYIEVLIAVVLLGTCLAPMLEALATGVRQQSTETRYELAMRAAQARLATLQGMDYDAVDSEAQLIGDASVATGLSDPPGIEPRILVFLARYDLDNADADSDPLTGGDAGLLWLRARSVDGAIDYQTLRADL